MPPLKLEASARSPQMIIAASGCGPPRHRWWSAVPAQGHPAVRSSVPTRSKKCPGIFDQGKGGSQHARTRSGVRLRLATITAGGCHVGQHPATSSVRIELIWEQEAAGSNPAISTRFFECVVSMCKQGRLVGSCRATRAGVAGCLRTLAALWLPCCRGIRLRPADRTSVRPTVTCSQASSRRRAERASGLSRPLHPEWVVGATPISAGAFISLSCREAQVGLATSPLPSIGSPAAARKSHSILPQRVARSFPALSACVGTS
jgi:hypothetical protein